MTDRSTDEARNSSTILRLWFTRSECVWISMPSSTLRAHDGARTRAPSISTTHTRQALTGVSVRSQHIVGISMPCCWATSRIV